MIREVYEESGIQVTNVTYQASQLWPFLTSIIFCFRALALTSEILIDRIDREEAACFSAKQLGGFGEWGDTGDGYCLPLKDSIA
ncbi:MAG: NAD+ diphosphatase, partial [Gammaproteobacteria bacterium]